MIGITTSLEIIPSSISSDRISTSPCDSFGDELLASKGTTICNGTLLSSQATSGTFTSFLLFAPSTYI